MVLSDCPRPLTSTTAHRLRRPRFTAALAASQTEPSAHSPSPMRTKVLAADFMSF